MAHGHADYGIGAPVQTVHTLSDMAELAARLGSPDTFDRRGNVLWYDDFEGGIERWVVGGAPPGGSLTWSSESSKTGRFCAKLTPPPFINGIKRMICYLGFPASARLGVEISIALSDRGCVKQELFLHTFVGTTALYAGLRYQVGSLTLSYLDHEGNYQDLSPRVRLGVNTRQFHIVKVVLDLDTQTYVRAVLDNVTFDLTGIKLPSQLSLEWSELRVQLDTYALTAAQEYILVDNVIVTMNEP